MRCLVERYCLMQKPQEALESFQRAFRMEPKLRRLVSYQVGFATSLASLGKTEGALAAYRDAARLDPKNAEALAGIGWALMELGNYKDAEQPLRKAIELDPDSSSPYLTLSYVLQELDRHEESIPFAERFVALKPNDFNGYVRLGWGLGQAGKYREAVFAYKKALELKPDEVAAVCGVGLFHYEAGDYKEAIEVLEKSISPQTNVNADAYSLIAAAKMMLGDRLGAIQAGEEAVELNPELSEAWHNLGQCYVETEQFDKAIASLERVLQLGPGIPDTHYLLGLAQFKLGNKSAALEQSDALEKLDSSKAQELRTVLSGDGR